MEEDKKDELMNEENVEKVILKAIKQYFKANRLADALFWKSAILMFKSRVERETVKKILRDNRVPISARDYEDMKKEYGVK